MIGLHAVNSLKENKMTDRSDEIKTFEPELDFEPKLLRTALNKVLSKVTDELGPFFPKVQVECSSLIDGKEVLYDLVYQHFGVMDLNWCVIYIMVKSKPWTKNSGQPFELGRMFLPLSTGEDISSSTHWKNLL